MRHARRLHRRDDGEQRGGHKDDDSCEAEHAKIDRRPHSRRGKSGGASGDEHLQPDPRDQDADRRAERRPAAGPRSALAASRASVRRRASCAARPRCAGSRRARAAALRHWRRRSAGRARRRLAGSTATRRSRRRADRRCRAVRALARFNDSTRTPKPLVTPRIAGRELRRQRVEFGLRLRDRDARLQPGDDTVAAGAALDLCARQTERREELAVLAEDNRSPPA